MRLDAWADSTSSSPAICVELSGDGGNTWTAARQTSKLGSSQGTFVLGSDNDKWGTSWTADELSNASFRVRLTTTSTSTSRDFRLDFVGVQVTYTPN